MKRKSDEPDDYDNDDREDEETLTKKARFEVKSRKPKNNRYGKNLLLINLDNILIY